jgi:hypothetical protein
MYIYVCTYAYLYIRMFVCKSICLHMYLYIYIYIRIYQYLNKFIFTYVIKKHFGYTRVTLIHTSGLYGTDGAAEFITAAAALGIYMYV